MADWIKEALALHRRTLVIDGHADTPQRFVDEGWEFTGSLNGGMLSLETARKGGLSAEFFAIWVEPRQWKGRFAERTLTLIEGVHEQIKRHPELRLCLSAEDTVAAHRNGQFAVLLGLEGGHSIENDLGLLRRYYDLGVRYMTLTWSNTNEWADSSGDTDDERVIHHGGLTVFGRNVIRLMNQLGMMIDVSHVADTTFWQVLEMSNAPVIASHSSVRSLTAAPRNLTDEMLCAMTAKNGIVMVNFYPAFIDETWRAAWEAQRPERQAALTVVEQAYMMKGQPVPHSVSNNIDKEFAAKIPRAPLSSLIDHIDHVAKIAGIDHVGIGTDFDGISSLPEGIDSAADLPKVTAALLERGYSTEDLEKLLGGNLLRVFGAVQSAAQR